MDKAEKYVVNDLDLSTIHNRNEVRVISAIKDLIGELTGVELNANAIQDIYATTLNALPPRYTQTGTIVLRDPVSAEEISKIVHEACRFVLSHPR